MSGAELFGGLQPANATGRSVAAQAPEPSCSPWPAVALTLLLSQSGPQTVRPAGDAAVTWDVARLNAWWRPAARSLTGHGHASSTLA
jgi:hypothetical protein